MKQKYDIKNIGDISLDIKRPSLIYIYGDLGAGKTTLSGSIINSLLSHQQRKSQLKEITSPTYVYYNKYQDVHHFDLYRLDSYEGFVSIGGEEILDNNEGVILVEWPEIIEKYYKADIIIKLTKTTLENEREIEIIYMK